MISLERPLPEQLKLLADGTRLRILALLEREELTVGDLSRSLGMAQSRVSNHLRQLREAGLLAERHAGSSTHMRLAASDDAMLGRLWATLRADLVRLPEHAADLGRLDAVLAERRGDDFFDALAGDYDKRAGNFETGAALERAAAELLPRDFVVADLGCGTGTMARPLLGLVDRLICVDRSEAMLREAEKRLSRAGSDIEFRQGAFESLPLADHEVDGVLCGLVLHHLDDLEVALAEMHRVLRPGGTAVVLELLPHGEEWMRAELGDRHLGLEPRDVARAFERAGFADVAIDAASDRYRPRSKDGREVALSLFLVRACRAPAESRRARTDT